MADRRRTMPTREQLRIWRDYTETADALRSRLAARLQSDSAMSAGDYQALLALTEAPGYTLRSSELAAAMTWERSRLSHHLGRMQDRGLITRRPCADGSHGVEVTATDAGREAFRAASVPHLRVVRELFLDALTPEMLAQLDTISTAMRAHLDLAVRPAGTA